METNSQTKNCNILIVDDDPFIRELLAEFLLCDYPLVDTAESGDQAMTMCGQGADYQIIVSDLEMPGMHGLDLIKNLRKSGNDTPIIVLTGNKDVSIALTALKNGANEYVVKDENIGDTVSTAIESALERKRLIDQNAQLIIHLTQAKEEAEKANCAKSDFLAKMSHDLKTPLNGIMGFAQLLLTDEDEPPSEWYKESLEQISKAGNHLLELINQILDLAAIEAGKIKVVIEDINVIPIIKESLVLIKPTASKREIEIVERIGHESLFVAGDSLRVKQVLLNLLSNGVKYNSKGGTLTVTLEKTADKARIHVRDTGPGIPEDKMEDLFDSFNRLGAEKTGVEGTGIGLNICKSFIDLMNGSLDIESKVGEGSCFSFSLPLSRKQESKS